MTQTSGADLKILNQPNFLLFNWHGCLILLLSYTFRRKFIFQFGIYLVYLLC